MVNAYRVRTIFEGVPGTPWYNNLFFTMDGTAQSAADLVRDFWSEYQLSMATGITATVQSDVAEVEEESGEIVGFTTTTTAPVAMAGTTEPLPWQTQGLIRLNTNDVRNGRRVIGHIFVPGPIEVTNDNGTPTAPYLALMAGTAGDLIGNVEGPNLLVYSRPTVSVGLGRFSLVVSATCPDKWSYLRSRRD